MATTTDNFSIEDCTTCAVCLGTLKTPKYFPCSHTFCEECLHAYILKTFGQSKEGVKCPICRTVVKKPDDVSVTEWSKTFPTNNDMIILIEMDRSNKDQKVCAACARDSETENACTWCVNCGEALCKSCDRSHRRNRVTGKHNLVAFNSDGTIDESLLKQADIYCSDHPDEVIKGYCYDHSLVCCTTCVMLKHRKCDNVGSVDEAADGMKQSEEVLGFSKELQEYKTILQLLVHNREGNLKSFDADIKKSKLDIESYFKKLSDKLNKLKKQHLSIVSEVEEDVKLELQDERNDINSKLSSIENDIALFQSSMENAPSAKFILTIQQLFKQKLSARNYVKDRKVRDIRVAFKPNGKLPNIGEVIKTSFLGENIANTLPIYIERSSNAKTDMSSVKPTLSSEVQLEFNVTGIAVLITGNILLSNNDTCSLELRDYRCLNVMSSLSLPGRPYGIKMMGHTDGGVVVKEQGVILFKVKNRQIVKLREIKSDASTDFVQIGNEYHIGCGKKVLVFDRISELTKNVSLDHNIGYMAVQRGYLCCSSIDEDKVIKITTFGYHSMTYTNKDLHDIRGVTVDHEDYMYVCGYKSKNVHQLDRGGQLKRIMFDQLTASPICISFSYLQNQAVIGCEGKILLFDLN